MTSAAKIKRYALALVAIPCFSFAAVPPTAPTNICLQPDNKCTTPPPTSGTGTKWHPGHYMLVYKDAPQSHFDSIFDKPDFKGVQVRYWWGDIEKSKGVYDFSQIESDLRYLQAHNKRLVIQLMDRVFSTGVKSEAVPSYLVNDPLYKGGAAPTKNGWIARIWDPNVMDRLIALINALGKRFDGEAYIEAIATEETAPGFNGTEPGDYSRSALARELKRMDAAYAVAFPHTVAIQYANSLSGELEGIFDNALKVGIGVGGPDLIPNNPTPGDILKLQYKNKMPMGNAVQSPELCGKEGCNTPEALLKYGVNTLALNYIFWIRFGSQYGSTYSFDGGIAPTVKRYNGLINTTCPGNIAPCNTN